MRVFIAHSIADEGETLERYKRQVAEKLAAAGITSGVEVVLGRDDFEQREKQSGGWNAWMRSVATGTVFGTRDPLFAAIVVPGTPEGVFVGRATSQIVSLALEGRKPVWVLFEDGTMRPAIAVEKRSTDARTGYAVIYR